MQRRHEREELDTAQVGKVAESAPIEREAVPQLALAPPRHREVGGQYDRSIACGGGPLDQTLRHRPVLVDVELEPARS